MRIMFAGLALLLAAAAAPQATKDWRTTTAATSAGAFVVGKPGAKIKLVEYLSFTCSHCGDFVLQSASGLHDGYVRNGSVQVETRSAARDPYDLAAWMVARCGGPQRFHALSTAIFRAQNDWMGKGETYARANLAALKAKPQLEQLRLLARHTGLAAIAQGQGVTPAALDRCMASDVQLKPILTMTQAAFAKISGTPAFEVNGTPAPDAYNWPTVDAKLRAAGAK